MSSSIPIFFNCAWLLNPFWFASPLQRRHQLTKTTKQTLDHALSLLSSKGDIGRLYSWGSQFQILVVLSFQKSAIEKDGTRNELEENIDCAIIVSIVGKKTTFLRFLLSENIRKESMFQRNQFLVKCLICVLLISRHTAFDFQNLCALKSAFHGSKRSPKVNMGGVLH